MCIVAGATTRGLKRERLEGWGIKGERQKLVPERVRIQMEMKRMQERLTVLTVSVDPVHVGRWIWREPGRRRYHYIHVV